jgi:hypothetical protein
MNDTTHLRTAIIGLVGFAALEEEMLLAAAGSVAEEGDSGQWAALPLVAHNTHFKHQQVCRLEAITRRETPPIFGEIDHSSDAVYRSYSDQSAAAVTEGSRRTYGALLTGLMAISDDDLLDPSRNPWLQGRQLWLQVIVRGFWHPTGHLGEHYLSHGRPDRAVALQTQAVATADYLRAPDPARGMANYNLACTQARVNLPDEALDALTRAVRLNRDLRAKVASDADLASLRHDRRLATLLAFEEGARQ